MIDDKIMKLIMSVPDRSKDEKDPMEPGMHGETQGPSEADELLRNIKDMITEYLGDEKDKKPTEPMEGGGEDELQKGRR